MKVFGVNGLDLGYGDLPYNRRKFVQFCLAETTDEIPLWPMFPVRLATLVRYAWWLQYHGIRGGMATIKNYVSGVTEWCQSLGHPDPRLSEPWVYQRFRKEAPKHLEVCEGSRAKFEIQPGHMREMARDFDLSNMDDLEDAVMYSVLYYSTIRAGHVTPASASKKDVQHLLKFSNIAFEPSFEEPETVVLVLDSTKTRDQNKKDAWWTAMGRCEVAALCPVRLLKLWYTRVYSGDPEQYVFARTAGALPRRRASFVRRLRLRLTAVAPRLGLDSSEFDATNWSSISFRKGGLSALAPHVQPHELAQHADHASVETTRKYYLSQTVEHRAANTALMARAIIGGGGLPPVRVEAVWSSDVVDGTHSAGPPWQSVYGEN